MIGSLLLNTRRLSALTTWRQSVVPAVSRALSLAVLAGMVLLAVPAPAGAQTPNQLRSIDTQSLAGNQMQFTLHMAAPPAEPLAFTIDKPARIALDLMATQLVMPTRRIEVGSGGVDTIISAESNGRTRVVLHLDQLLPYAVHTAGNDIVVVVGAQAASVAGGAAPVAAASDGTTSLVHAPRLLKSIDFRRGEAGAGRLIVKLNDPRTPINLGQQGSQVTIDFSGTDVAQKLQRRYDTQDFGTPVSGFEVSHLANGDARVVITASGEFERAAYQADDQYVVEISPVRKNAAVATEEKHVYKGERLTLNFQDIEVRAVLQLLADASGQNIVVSDTVNGNVTLRLQNVPWDQAMDVVLRNKGLDKRQEGNVILVGPAQEIATREKAELAARKDMQSLEALRTEYIQINYAKAADVAALLHGSGGGGGGGNSAGGGSSGGSVLSDRGSVAVDERTNTLLIQDTAAHIADVRRLIAVLDIPVKQVLIETRLVIVNNDFERDLGAVLGLTGLHQNGKNGMIETTGTSAGIDTGVSSALNNLASTGSVTPVGIATGATAANRYNVNLPVASPAGSIALGILGANYLVDLELSAMQSEGRGTVVQSPRVVTANQKEATIEQGTEIPYQQSASSGATTISFKKAVLSLKAKPLITPDNRIILDVTVSDDTVGKVVVTSGGVNVPAIDTRSTETQVLLNDGETVVLGGILNTTQTDSQTKVPLLGDIPVLGNLFKTTTKINNKDELLIFITAKILREGTGAN